MSLNIKKHVVDRMLFNDRCLEEEDILFHEMANFLSFYKDVLLPSLENRKEQYLCDLEALQQNRGSCFLKLRQPLIKIEPEGPYSQS